MKKSFFLESFKMLLVILVCSLLGSTDVSLAVSPGVPMGETGNGTAEGVAGVAGVGTHLEGGFSVEGARREADDLLLTAVDKVVTKIYPWKSPLDQLFRFSQNRTVTGTRSMIVQWKSVDTKPFTTTIADDGAFVLPGTPTNANSTAVAIKVDDASVFAKTSTILVPSILGYDAAGNRSTDVPLLLYVKAKTDSTLTVMAVNGGTIAGTKNKFVPSIPAGTELLRQGRAAYEKDIQTEASSSYPTTEENYMQAFKCQVEETFWYKNSEKLLDWTMQDQKEMAIMEWKMEMEATYLNGVKGIVMDSTEGKGEVYTCNGILRYIKKSYEYPYSGWTVTDFTGVTKAAFTGNAGSPKRVLLMGADLMESIMNVDITLMKGLDRASETYWNIEFTTIKTNFGKLLCLHWELLDNCGMSDQGLLIDPNNIGKYVFEAENSLVIDNRKTGVSNTEADVTTEVSCPFVKYPQTHLVIKKGEAILPIANAGSDISVAEGAAGALDGSGSTVGSGTALTYEWTAPAGIVLSNTAAQKPTFTAPAVAADTDYVISLVVNDGISDSVANTVKVTVTAV